MDNNRNPKNDRVPLYYHRFSIYFTLVLTACLFILAFYFEYPSAYLNGVARKIIPLLVFGVPVLLFHLLLMENQTLRLYLAEKNLQANNRNLNIILAADDKINRTLDVQKRLRTGLATATRLLPLKSGFVMLQLQDERIAIADYHLTSKRAAIIIEHLREKGLLQKALHHHTERNVHFNGSGEHFCWENLLIIRFAPAKETSFDFTGVFVLNTKMHPEISRLIDLYARKLALVIETALLHQQVVDSSRLDMMTELYNHSYFYELYTREMNLARRHSLPLSLMISDIDDFKKYVDANGHLRADGVLKELGQLIRKTLRETDVVARYGGDEFSYILTHTSKQSAAAVAQKDQQTVADYPFRDKDGRTATLTLSFGVSAYPEDGEHTEDLLEKADKAMFQAKEQGKNRICVWQAPPV